MSDVMPHTDCISDLVFDEWLAGALEPAEAAPHQAHLAICVRCALRCEALTSQRAAFLQRVPSWRTLRERQRGGPPARARRRLIWGSGVALAAAAWLALALPPRVLPTGVRSKGGPKLGAFVKRGERVTRAVSGERVRPGDRVRFTYSSDEPVYFALLNRDARGATTYHPLGAEAVRLAPGRDVALDFSIELDAEPGVEHVHGLFCDGPRQLEPLRKALETSGRLPPLQGCRVEVLTLAKQAAER